MKILLTTLLLLAAAPSLAAQTDGPRGERLQRQKNQQERVAPQQERHRDRSGERAERRQRILERFDTNGDGRLDEAERAALRAAAEQMRAQRGEKQRRQRPEGRERREGAERKERKERKECKERGKAGERAESRQRILERFDVDGDGRLNELEREALRRAIEERRAERGVEGQQRRVRGQGQRERGEGRPRPQR
jgi:hypothetical protein